MQARQTVQWQRTLQLLLLGEVGVVLPGEDMLFRIQRSQVLVCSCNGFCGWVLFGVSLAGSLNALVIGRIRRIALVSCCCICIQGCICICMCIRICCCCICLRIHRCICI